MGAVAVHSRGAERAPSHAHTGVSPGAFVSGSVAVHLLAASMLPALLSAAREHPATTTVEFTIAAPEPVSIPEPEPEPVAELPPPPVAVRPAAVTKPVPAAPPPVAPPPTAVVALAEGDESGVEVVAVERPVESVPVLAAPLPTVTAQPTPIAVTHADPQPDVRALTRGYLSDLTRMLHQHRRYPAAALRERLEGTVLVSITIDGQGRIRDVALKRSSGHALLDRSALLAVRGTPQLPLPPSEMGWTTRAVTLPIAYVLR